MRNANIVDKQINATSKVAVTIDLPAIVEDVCFLLEKSKLSASSFFINLIF
jgi:hypothetical protein